MLSEQSRKNTLTLWRCGERVGQLGKVTTDQPWFCAPIHYDDPQQGARFERVCHFLYQVVENLPDIDDPVEDDRLYDEALHKLGLEQDLVAGFLSGPWELHRGDQCVVIDFHSLRGAMLQWRGPMDRSFL